MNNKNRTLYTLMAARSGLGMALMALAGGCVGEPPPQAPELAVEAELEDGHDHGQALPMHVIVPKDEIPPELASTFRDSSRTRLVYLNRTGGTYTKGWNNASANTSHLIDEGARTSIPAFHKTDGDWQEIVDCMRDQFAPFNIEFTDADPGQTPHMEAVVGGRPQLLGLADNVGGIAPMYGDCSTVERSIVFIFAQRLRSNRSICEVMAHEVGHSIGLEHQYLCEDPMTYLYGCGAKKFQNQQAACGTYEAEECQCSGGTQNTYEVLTDRLGLKARAPADPPDDGDQDVQTPEPTPEPEPVQPAPAPPAVQFVTPSDETVFGAGDVVQIRVTTEGEATVRGVWLRWISPGSEYAFQMNDLGQGSYGINLRLPGQVNPGARLVQVTVNDAEGLTAESTRMIYLE